jgi:hypothetical protein
MYACTDEEQLVVHSILTNTILMTTRIIFPIAVFRLRLTILYVLLGLILSGGLTGCEKEDIKPHSEVTVKPHSEVTAQWVLDRLYFGRFMPSGEEVSVDAWSGFLAEVITPCFPEGFTWWDANGQWQEEDGIVVWESTFILEIVHLKSKADDDKLKAIIEVYKKRFQQGSVLHVTHPANAEF